ncbi:MAG: 2-dehydropantoate 2-reductase [Thermoanaerobaculia bacterium]
MPARRRQRVLVLGTGAMGCLFAASLGRCGACDVTVSGSWHRGLSTLDEDGIAVEDRGSVWKTVVRTRRLDRLDPAYDLVLVLTTSRRTAAVAAIAADTVAADGLILTLQNGLGNREVLAASAGEMRVAAGATAVGATLLGPGRVRIGGRGPTILGGPGGGRDRLERVREILAESGFAVEVTADLHAALWTKLAVNCAINPLSAIARVPNGRLVAVDAWRLELEEAAREVGRVAAAKGIHIGLDLARHAADVARATARNRSSMLQDLDAGHPTEIDALCGAVVAEARRVRVPVPVNARLAYRVRALERIAHP